MDLYNIKAKADKIYKRDLYTMEDVDYILSKRITEYDMKEAGWNLIQYYDLLPNKRIKELELLSKTNRTIQIGKFMRDDKTFNKELTYAFRMMRKKFFEKNDLSKNDILSIKKDAIYVVGRICKHKEFKNVQFVEKHTYTSFHRFGNIEMYYQYSTNTLHIKGINDEQLVDHEEYMISVLKKIFHSLEVENRKVFVKLIKDFVMRYKYNELELGYYRELNSDSSFTLNKDANSSDMYLVGLSDVDESIRSQLNISYNYINYILPIIQRFYFMK